MRTEKLDWIPDWKKQDQYPDPDKMTSEDWAWEFLRRNTKYQQDWETARENPDLAPGFASHWGLTKLAPPELARNCNLFLNFTTAPNPRVSSRFEMTDGTPVWETGAPSAESACAFVVDLDASINTQIVFIKKHLIAAQKRRGKILTTKQTSLYPVYLRCFDGDERGEGSAAISQVLGIEIAKIPGYTDQAKRLVDGRYGAIPMTKDLPKESEFRF